MNKRKIMLFIADTAIYAFASAFILMLVKNTTSVSQLLIYIASIIIPILAMRIIAGVYNRVWRYAKYTEYLRLIMADFVGGCILLIVDRFIFLNIDKIEILTISECFAIVAIPCLITIAARYAYQYICYGYESKLDAEKNRKINVAIVGAGQIGCALADELRASKTSNYNPYCFIDINNDKIGNYVNGIKVISAGDDIAEKIKELPVQEVIIAIGSLSPEERSAMYDKLKMTGCIIKTYDFVDGTNDGEKRSIRNVEVKDLLFRETIELNTSTYNEYYTGKTVLVTGGSGSIGSELCSMLCKVGIKQLIILDIYENTTYTLLQELKRKHPSLDIRAEISSVRDARKIDTIISYYKPDIIFHAAAHKHVPLMEHNSAEAIKNNVLGTYNVANSAEKNGVGKFILISTDKAVNPTNIMGASKRVCEMIIQCRTDSKTKFAAVRFGNVLGSNGSVIPIFKKQIEAGGPVTITDKRIIRYFMTISEAASLVMHTASMAQSGELFVLDMGKPVKILKLAEDMIRLSGFAPYSDIQIIETGLRPGEKLYEELLCKNEELDKTSQEKIFIERDKPCTREEVDEKIKILCDAVNESLDNIETFPHVREAMRKVVPTYHDPEEVNAKAESAEEVKMVK